MNDRPGFHPVACHCAGWSTDEYCPTRWNGLVGATNCTRRLPHGGHAWHGNHAAVAGVQRMRCRGVPLTYPAHWLVTEVQHRAIMLGYWIRPYDGHLDARRWRWQESACARSRRLWRAVMPVDSDAPLTAAKGDYIPNTYPPRSDGEPS